MEDDDIKQSPSLEHVIITKFAKELHTRTWMISHTIYTMLVRYALTQPGHIAEVALLYKLIFYCNHYSPDRELVYGMLMAWMEFGSQGCQRDDLRSGHTTDQIDEFLLEAAELTLRQSDRSAFCCFLETHYAYLSDLKTEPLFQEMCDSITSTLLNDALTLKIGLNNSISDLALYMPRESSKLNGWFARFIAKTLTTEHCMRNYRKLMKRLRQNKTKPVSTHNSGFPAVFLPTYYLHGYDWVDVTVTKTPIPPCKEEDDDVEDDDVEDDGENNDGENNDDVEDSNESESAQCEEEEEYDFPKDDELLLPGTERKSWLRWFFGLN